MSFPSEVLLQELESLASELSDQPFLRFRLALQESDKHTIPVDPIWNNAARHLAGLEDLSAPETRNFTRAVIDQAATLRWQQKYTVEKMPQTFLENNCWADIVGRDGPFYSSIVRVGVYLIGPGQVYPSHAHEAEEAYLPVAGCAAWQKNSGGFELKEPGARIFHASWEPHAMRTLSTPLLAVYFWMGKSLSDSPTLLSSKADS